MSRRRFLGASGAAGILPLPALAAPAVDQPPLLWLSNVPASDSHVAFRGRFETAGPTVVEIQFLGASWFDLWLDGEFVADGPARFPQEFPQYQILRREVSAGRHLLSAHVHSFGVSTRLIENIAPFWTCRVLAGSTEVGVSWKAAPLKGYGSAVRRINPQLGWMEWVDTQQLKFDDTAWAVPTPTDPKIGALKPLATAEVRHLTHPLQQTAQGELIETFGYEADDPPARFFLRRLERGNLPAQGVWRRYDLGRVRLGRARLTIDAPAGAVVECAYCEALEQGRVTPWITLSAGQSCNMDHFVARGGEQEFVPLSPKGGRFIEVHVLAPAAQVRFVREEFVERTYHGAPEGSFQSGDALLDRIWTTGIETYRACSEDAVIDNPTRERGQWAGDVATVGMEIAAAGFSDLRLFRRGLIQCAQCAREDGLIAGLCPGGRAYLTTYAAQWVTACLRYWQLTGDQSLLHELLLAAEHNIGAFEKWWTADGVTDGIGWGFVDWGYVRNEGPVDIGVNLHLVAALRDMARWCQILGEQEKQARYRALERRLRQSLTPSFAGGNWATVGLHRTVLGLILGFVSKDQERAAVEQIKTHILRSFPLSSDAPRLSGPAANNPQLFTPYFAHYVMPVLIERGEMDFVLDIYRKAWGWALGDGRTTWLEVFDTRWSHCHAWAGCPTWQLTRYVLGLNRRFDLGPEHYVCTLRPGFLERAQGSLPMSGGGEIKIAWTREGGDIRYRLDTPRPIVVHFGDGAPVGVTGHLERIVRPGVYSVE
ncbi:MAG: family 78 glycoside hydrolase catalytic domain [Bryobacteraceae bacterium]